MEEEIMQAWGGGGQHNWQPPGLIMTTVYMYSIWRCIRLNCIFNMWKQHVNCAEAASLQEGCYLLPYNLCLSTILNRGRAAASSPL